MQLRKERREARDNVNGEKEKELHENVRNSVKNDKRKYWASLLDWEEWKEVKYTKAGFTAKYTRIRHKNGVVVTSEERPDILADYFENVQWGNTTPPEKKSNTTAQKNSERDCFLKKQPT